MTGTYVILFRRKDGRWSWRLVIDGENECGDNSNGFGTREECYQHVVKCLSYMIYDVKGLL
jgi:hypothetical protein